MAVLRHTGMHWAGALLALLLHAVPAAAQDLTPAAQKRQELEERRARLKEAQGNETRIRAEIGEIAQERARLAADLVATGERIREGETRIADSEQRLRDLSAQEADVQGKLRDSRSVVAELLAALERLGRSPPPALLVKPGDALASVRSAMLLGTLLPEIRQQADELSSDLRELARVRADLETERASLATEYAEQQAVQARLSLLVEARQQRETEQQAALGEERQLAQSLGREVRSLEELIGRMERDVASARKAAEAAAEAAPRPGTTPGRGDLAALKDPGRLTPAVSFAAAKGLLPLPVNGMTVTGFGEDDAYGSTQKGVSISTRSRAQVTSPCDGWVVYAGPFRSYGQVLILNAGGGYHVLLAGMQKVDVALGQFVLTGEPVAEMGEAANQTASMVGGGATQPVLYVEFRKDGQSINPGPWWANSSAEKVRG
jgi:murein hydrolase activator